MNLVGAVFGAISAGIIGWLVFCALGGAMMGAGTQRLPDPNTASGANVSDLAQFLFAYFSRGSADAAKTFMKDKPRGPIAGANGDMSAQPLPIDDRKTPNLPPQTQSVGADMSGEPTTIQPVSASSNALMDGQMLTIEELQALQQQQQAHQQTP